MEQTIFTFSSKTPGPTVAIFGGVHGNELAGIRTLDYLRENLEVAEGTVHLVYANPRAIAKNTRYTEKNLNRCFQESSQAGTSFEEKRAVELMKLLDTSDALLDLHAYTEKNGEATPFAITELNAKSIVETFDLKYVITGIDNIEKGGTDGYMSNQGKIGICVELGSINEPDRYLGLGIQTAYQFLQYFNIVEEAYASSNTQQTVLKADGIYVKQNEDFTFAQKFMTFDTVSNGQLICRDGKEEIRATKDMYLLFPGGNHPVGVEAYLTATDV